MNTSWWRKFWRTLGPGIITGAADDDPSGIATYSQAGAQYGYQFLSLSFFSFPLMGVVQEMCARLGLVTGKGLAQNIRERYPVWVLYMSVALLVAANTFNIGADFAAIGEAIALVVPAVPAFVSIAVLSVLIYALEVFTSYRTYAKYLKYSAIALFAYVAVGFIVHANWAEVFTNLVTFSFPLTKDSLLLICAILGTTISPYLFFWQTSQEVEEEITTGKLQTGTPVCTPDDIASMRTDIWSGMLVSNVVMFFIILACGATLHMHGVTNITTAADAAKALEPIAGQWAFLLFALGIVGTGLLAIPVLAGSSAYAVTEALGWKEGLYNKYRDARAFYGIIGLSIAAGVVMNMAGLDPIKTLIYSAVANGVIAPVILFFVVRLTSANDVMGEHVSGRVLMTVGWLTVVTMALAGIAALYALFS